ncbi:L-2-amino-thiazoline-4-carboxylic acid hydrolase [Paratractidigestivibacter sp.]|uniref:L-2-amino-thiazoline-4-carboxylic acid hydrolase n=1 Tax=Paratractidigestivibacter sp. TaxID=2847316 RepID=UPI002ABE73D4|nr:L-2-amino-thiazoline-4-carboxylic acid hydrolase [Paratractidigestivibacter sp.]
MDKLAKIFDNGKKINVIKDVAVQTIGAEETQRAWAQARGILAELLAKYPQLTPKEEEHTDLIFSHIAVYRALMAAHPDVAMKIMEQGEAVTAKQTGATFQKVVRLPLGKTLFFKAFAAGCKSGFGPEAGFANTVHTATASEYRMDMTACPYATYCTAEGCPELTHIFCDNDLYAYAHLDGIRFAREETLGTGGTKCDFWLKRD